MAHDAQHTVGPDVHLSEDAKRLCARWFAGPRNTVKSNPPHKTLAQVTSAINELMAAGLVTRHEFNRFGVFEFRGSPEASAIGRAYLQADMASLFAPEPATQPQP